MKAKAITLFVLVMLLISSPSNGQNTCVYERGTNMFQGQSKSLDVINDGQNDKFQPGLSGNYSGQQRKLTRIE